MLTSDTLTNFAKFVDDSIVEIADGKQRFCVEISLNGFAAVNSINHPSNVDIFLNEKGFARQTLKMSGIFFRMLAIKPRYMRKREKPATKQVEPSLEQQYRGNSWIRM